MLLIADDAISVASWVDPPAALLFISAMQKASPRLCPEAAGLSTGLEAVSLPGGSVGAPFLLGRQAGSRSQGSALASQVPGEVRALEKGRQEHGLSC